MKDEVLNMRLLFFFLSVASGHKADPSKHVLLMDEVDGMAGNEDRGGMQVWRENIMIFTCFVSFCVCAFSLFLVFVCVFVLFPCIWFLFVCLFSDLLLFDFFLYVSLCFLLLLFCCCCIIFVRITFGLIFKTRPGTQLFMRK